MIVLSENLFGNSTVLKILEFKNFGDANELYSIFLEMVLKFFFDSQELFHVTVGVNFDDQEILPI